MKILPLLIHSFNLWYLEIKVFWGATRGWGVSPIFLYSSGNSSLSLSLSDSIPANVELISISLISRLISCFVNGKNPSTS